MEIKGKVWKFGDDVDTDVIIPAQYLNTSDPKELASHVMAGAGDEFANNVQVGDIIVAGRNFGCGSSREHAPIAIKAAGVSAVIAGSYARIFYRNCFNIGLPIFESPELMADLDNIDKGDEFLIDVDKGVVKNITKYKEYVAIPIPEFMQELINSGGLINWTKEKLSA